MYETAALSDAKAINELGKSLSRFPSPLLERHPKLCFGNLIISPTMNWNVHVLLMTSTPHAHRYSNSC